MQTDQPSAPAGWFSDPDGQVAWRYWDGSAWTNQLVRRGRPESAPVQSTQGAPQPVHICQTFWVEGDQRIWWTDVQRIETRDLQTGWKGGFGAFMSMGGNAWKEVWASLADGSVRRVTLEAPYLTGAKTLASAGKALNMASSSSVLHSVFDSSKISALFDAYRDFGHAVNRGAIVVPSVPPPQIAPGPQVFALVDPPR